MTNDNRRIHLGGTARRPEDVISLHLLGLQFAEVPIKNPEKFSADVERFRQVQVETEAIRDAMQKQGILVS